MKTLMLQLTTYFKTMLREPVFVIWSILWPCLLTVFYIIAFSGIGKESLEPFTVAIHRDNISRSVFSDIEIMDVTIVEEDSAGLDLLYPQESNADNTAADQAEAAADQSETTDTARPIAYLDKDNTLHYPTEKANAVELSILRTITDSIASSQPLIEEAVRNGVPPSRIMELIDFEQPIENRTVLGAMDPMSIPYLAIFGMVTLMGSFSSQDFVVMIQADQSVIGVRQAISPIKKSRLIFMAILSSFIFIMLAAIFLIFFMHFVAGIELLPNFWLNVLLLALPILGNLALGTWIGVLPVSAALKPGICMVFMLGFSTLAGLMTPDLVYMLRQRAPIVLELNPVYRLSQALMRVNLLDRSPRLESYALFFLIYTLIFVAGSIFVLRRQQFKSLARN